MRVASMESKMHGYRNVCRQREYGRADGRSALPAETLDGIDALAVQPNANDKGAPPVLRFGCHSADCSAEHLLQFAVIGAALVSVLRRTPPRQRGVCSNDWRNHQDESLSNAGEAVLRGCQSG